MILLPALATMLACGSSGAGSPAASATIGAAGGTVSLPGGPSLSVPAGALSLPTELTVADSGKSAATGGTIWWFGPTTTVLAMPVTVSMPVPAGTVKPVVFWYGSGGLYAPVPTTVAAGIATAQVPTLAPGHVGPTPITASPTITPGPGTYDAPVQVAMASSTSHAIIHFTLDGSVPTTASPIYGGPFEVGEGMTVRAMAESAEHDDSAVAGVTYAFTTPTAAAPTILPSFGNYASDDGDALVGIWTTTPGATIHYTFDGSSPTRASPVYAAPFPVGPPPPPYGSVYEVVVKAFAVAPGRADSGTSTAWYGWSAPP